MEPYYSDRLVTIYHGDCRDVLPQLDEQAQLILADPPYGGLLDEVWDQWENTETFLEWLNNVCTRLKDSLVDNGSLYMFCSPVMSARVETVIARTFHVLGNYVWDKGHTRMGVGSGGIDPASLRSYWAQVSERIIFAEKPGTMVEDKAKQDSGYWAALEGAKRSVFGDYLKSEFQLAEVANRDIAALFPSRTGALTGCVSNWLLGYNIPTAVQYRAMRSYLGGSSYLKKNYEELRKSYLQLKRKYGNLKAKYEDLRRPFHLEKTDQWGDVWHFDIARQREHPAQKPLSLITQLVRVSSDPGNLIIDPFMGSGTTLLAAKNMGRKAIGIELEEKYCEIAAERVRTSRPKDVQRMLSRRRRGLGRTKLYD